MSRTGFVSTTSNVRATPSASTAARAHQPETATSASAEDAHSTVTGAAGRRIWTRLGTFLDACGFPEDRQRRGAASTPSCMRVTDRESV